MATVRENGFQPWETRTRAPLGETVPRVLRADFSPSGRTLVLLALAEENPYESELVPSLREIRDRPRNPDPQPEDEGDPCATA